MKKYIGFLSLTVISAFCMESTPDAKKEIEKKVVWAMIEAVRPSYEEAFRVIDGLEAWTLGRAENVGILKKIATRNEYRHLLEYAFDKKKILPTDELASSLLLEAAAGDDSSYNLEDLLRYGVDPNKPGKMLVWENRDKNMYTPLIVAIINEHYLNVNELLAKGADANACQPHENLPLMEAMLRLHKWRYQKPTIKDPRADKHFIFASMVYRLKEKGADKLKDNGKDVLIHWTQGGSFLTRTPFDMSCQLGYEGI